MRDSVNLRDILRVSAVLGGEFLAGHVGSLMRLDVAAALQARQGFGGGGLQKESDFNAFLGICGTHQAPPRELGPLTACDRYTITGHNSLRLLEFVAAWSVMRKLSVHSGPDVAINALRDAPGLGSLRPETENK